MPAWLRRLRPYLLLALFTLPAAWPFVHPGLPRSNDNLFHYFRVVELDRLVRAGVLLPRWAPDLVHGYGYPVFNFFPYLSHYVAEVFHLLGLEFLPAFKAAYFLALLCAGWFAYRLGREHFGEKAGLVAGAAYAFSPYVLYNVHVRGALPESTALALLPLAMLHLRRAARGRLPSVAWAGLALAALLLAHNAVGLQAMWLLGLYAVWEAFTARPEPQAADPASPFRRLSFVILSFTLALLFSAFYWLPALAEIQYVQFDNAVRNGSMLYFNHFLELGELFALPRLPVDPDLLNPPVVRSLPLAALGLAGAGLAARLLWRRLPAAHARTIIFLSGLALLAAFLILPASRPVWEALPLLRLTLFPWRLLGPITLFVALLAGAPFAPAPSKPAAPIRPLSLRSSHLSFFINRLSFGVGYSSFFVRPFRHLSLAIFILVLAGLPYASPPREPAPANPTLADLAAFELAPDLIGTTTASEFLPIWVRQLPDTAANRDRLMAGEPLQRYTLTPAAAQVVSSAVGRLNAAFEIASPEPAAFVWHTFYFPGWRAVLDGQPASIRITYPEGLISVAVPPGEHTLAFSFGTTPPRAAGGVLALAAALISLWLVRRAPIAPRPRPPIVAPATAFTPALFLIAAALAAARPLLYDAGRTPLLRRGLQPEGLAGVAHPLNHDFASELTLLGWEAERESIAADETFAVNLYWQARQRLGLAYGFALRLVDAEGLVWSQADTPRPRDWRFTPGTDFWPPDEYILDPYLLTPLAGTPPGEYYLEVDVFAYHNLQSIGAARLGAMAITAPSRARGCARNVAEAALPALDLQRAEFSAAQGVPGQDVVASLCWHALQPLPHNEPAELRLLDAGGAPAAARPFIIGTRYPTSKWRTGDVVSDKLIVRLPATLETGRYVWELTAQGAAVSLGALNVTAPVRSFTPPEAAAPILADLGPVTLYGADLPGASLAPGARADVGLIWKANRTPDASYHVFLHLMDPAGELVAQSDGVPADWSRLTAGWLPGEYVAEIRTLVLPPGAPAGDYAVWAGMYDPRTGERLLTDLFPDGRVRLGSLTVQP